MYIPSHYDEVNNVTTGLMALRDVASYEGVPINVQLCDHWIHVIVGFGTPFMKKHSFYMKDTYRAQGVFDPIYKWIAEAIDEIKAMRDEDSTKRD